MRRVGYAHVSEVIMGTSTFSGPVRTKNGFNEITVDGTTGAITTVSAVSHTAMVAGSGITSGTGTLYNGLITKTVTPEITWFYTRVFIDLTGLSDGGTTLDIIGVAAAANCHLGQITTAANGAIYVGSMTCLELPLTGGTDIDLYTATVATGVNDTLVTALDQTELLNAGASTLNSTDALTTIPPANGYLYLAGVGTGDAVYTGGRLFIELYGSNPT